MLVLYQRETCPDCKPVRELLTRLQISYMNVNVPKPREERHELIRVTGSKFIPALVDGATVLPGKLKQNADLIAYLTERYADPEAVRPEGAGDAAPGPAENPA
ncbi:glutaredoxin domain-containing protein [Streptomyces sp. HNM0574]|uniref:glutaredoxin domain-containing protein n=1 Tax=Streptomyces sp. HNM0574 TaxID=2714954 RepID=UPI00146CCC0B|nr:glutaredoxin domain-containing protein [Streptomyces sp. HNM0574]NLU69833.1 glutaredoxin [Streptomyces sp. HNM0574]